MPCHATPCRRYELRDALEARSAGARTGIRVDASRAKIVLGVSRGVDETRGGSIR